MKGDFRPRNAKKLPLLSNGDDKQERKKFGFPKERREVGKEYN